MNKAEEARKPRQQQQQQQQPDGILSLSHADMGASWISFENSAMLRGYELCKQAIIYIPRSSRSSSITCVYIFFCFRSLSSFPSIESRFPFLSLYVMMRNAGGGLHYFSFIFPRRLVSLLNNSRTGFIDNQFDGGFPFQLARFVCVMTTAVNIVLRPRPQSVSCIPELHPPATVCDNDDDVGLCPDDQRM